MKYAAFAVVLVLLTFSGARAEMFDVVNIPDEEKFSLRFHYKGIDINKPPDKPYVLRYTAAESSVSAVYITRMVGSGAARHVEVEINGVKNNGYKSREIFRYQPGKKLVLAYIEKSVFSPSGRKIRTESYDLTESIPPWPEKMTHPYTLPLALRGMDFTPGKEASFHVWFNPTMVFAMKLLVKGEEDITVPAGKFRCYRLEMGPDLADFAGPVLGRVLKPLIAPYVAWLDTKPPHRIVRYKGPFGMVNIAGPSEIYELVKVGD